MNTVHQSAIVLGGVNYSDSSRVVWTLTPDYGRQSFMVKGARRLKSKYLGSLETFNLVRMIYRKGERKSLYTLRDVDVENHFSGIRQSLDAFWAANQAVELLKAVTHEEHESRDLFELIRGFLTLADRYGNDSGFLKASIIAFRWRLTSILGHEPQLVECVRCGCRLSRAEKYRFVPARGGALCSECGESPEFTADRTSTANVVSYNGMRFIYKSSRHFPSSPDDLPQLAPGEFGEVESLSYRYIAYHLGEETLVSKSDPGRRRKG